MRCQPQPAAVHMNAAVGLAGGCGSTATKLRSRLHIELPSVFEASVLIMSKLGTRMAMFSIGKNFSPLDLDSLMEFLYDPVAVVAAWVCCRGQGMKSCPLPRGSVGGDVGEL
ncbi:unnamed protein product [Miscanthus lutarioriparius]|uniref:Uncharacterized protein n=1 Tax=Miscanthus lutarioriparius TaxID=422564 RepID=A0A811MNF4_9POAL|nr:unnamed protein product [Miscanthus lutarioriparius]